MELTLKELQILLDMIGYSLDRVRNQQGTPRDVREKTLSEMHEVKLKISKAIQEARRNDGCL